VSRTWTPRIVCPKQRRRFHTALSGDLPQFLPTRGVAVVCGRGVKLNCRVRWRNRVQANEAGVATQEAGAVETSHASSAAA
jgi:hypothetical protein